MLFHYITVKSEITKTKISTYCGIFFKLNFTSQYISVQVKVRDITGQTHNIGKKYNVDVSNPKSLTSYKTKIFDEYQNYLFLGNKSKITRFIFEYKPLNTIDLINANNEKIH